MDQAEAKRQVERAVALLRQRDGAGARPILEAVAASGALQPPPWMLLAQACLLAGDEAGEDRALTEVLRLEPDNLRGLLMRGDWHHRAGNGSLACRFYNFALRRGAAAARAAPDVLTGLARARERVAAEGAAQEARLRRAMAEAGHPAPPARILEAIDILMGRAEPQRQAPTNFFLPGTTPVGFHDRADFPWIEALEAQAPAIAAELETAEAEAFRPYVTPDPSQPRARHKLLNDPAWSALHLVQHGRTLEAAARFPAAVKAAALAERPLVAGHFPNVMFSRLAPGARIPPHCGLYNIRLICHLALVAPEGAALRCGNGVRPHRAGKAFVFDDSMEHEAWNEAATPRTILLFDVWRPDLGAEERAALTALFGAIGGPAPGEG